VTEFEGGAGTVRSVVGAIVAPLGAFILYGVMILVRNRSQPLWVLNFQIGLTLHSTFLNPLRLIEVYAFELLIGLPVHLQLQKRGITSLRAYLLAGALILVVPVALAWFVVAGPRGVLLSLLAAGPFGLTWAAIFWLIARPDRRTITPTL
jgi:hypothetical protein